MKKILFALFLFSSYTFFAQGEANHWFFGEGAGIDFNGETATPISGSLNTNEGCASFSNSNGELLFYTDGITVWNKNHNPMPSADGTLKGHPSSTQSAIIVPNPSNTNLYYIFTVGARTTSGGEYGFYSYTVDMTRDGGLGDIVGTGVKLSGSKSEDWTEKVTSVKGADCNTFWVISLVENTYYSFKVDDVVGLNTTPVTSTVNYDSTDRRGYLKASPDGKKIASATFTIRTDSNGNNVIGPGRLHLYSFNDTTGEVINDGIRVISDAQLDGAPYGVEFSPNSTKLYASTFDGYKNKLFQFNLEATDIQLSKYLIDTQIGYRGGLQLAPNGKIYATVPLSYGTGTRFLNAINLPDALGINCGFIPKAIDLGTTGRAMQGLPPFIASILLPVEITDGNSTQNINNTIAKRCIGENYQLTVQDIEGTPTYKWIFNGKIVSTTDTLSLPNLSSIDEGTYNFEAETIDDCGFTFTYKGNVTLEVYQPPTISKPTNILQCDDDENSDGFYDFDFSATTLQVLNGQDDTLFEVVYFTDALQAESNGISTVIPYTNTTAYTEETLYARIHNIQNPICYEIESFKIQVFEAPAPPAVIPNLTQCDSNIVGTDSDGFEIFDLTSKESEVLSGQVVPSNFTITYFEDAAYTIPVTTTKTAYKNTQPVQPIYFHVTNNLNTNCIISSSFNIEVFSLPVINNYFEFKQCDEDGNPDGFTDFNLTEANDYLTLNDSALMVTYHLSANDAETNNTSTIVVAPFSNKTASTVYARIENLNGCYRIAQVDLLVSSTSFPDGYLKQMALCDDDDIIDGLRLFNLSDNDAEIINLFPTGQNLSVAYYTELEDAQLEQNAIDKTVPYFSETPFNQILFVRVESDDNGECFGLGPYLELIVDARPEFDLNDTAIYCTNLKPITVAVNNANGIYTYSWTDESNTEISDQPYAIISKEGTYTVIATSTVGCESFPQSILIEASSIAAISEEDITVTDDSTNNTITISTSNLGIGDYEFALETSFSLFQEEPYFENVAPGIHTIYIRDKNSCGIASVDVSVIGYPKFFTPNNDGINDTWQVLGINENFYNASNIYIYDRYGKLITKIDPRGKGWNGVFNGQTLPSSDYWFSVELIDKDGTLKIRKGHFSLVRK